MTSNMEAKMTRSDNDIRTDVIEHIDWDDRVDASSIDVNVDAGAVTLKGSVPSYLERTAAYFDAWAVRGVVNVIDDLTVHRPDEIAEPSDDEVRENIVSIFISSANIDENSIKAYVNAGHVMLQGSVDSYWQKEYASELTSQVQGVVDINNQLTIVPGEDMNDQDIAEDIIAALNRDVRVSAGAVNVAVRDGVVKLTGTVPSYQAKKAAREAACNTMGVLDVEDEVVVQYV